MKKVLCVLMCAVLLLAMPMTAFAADTPYSGQGSSTITYKSYSTCTVSIPETIEITGAPTEIVVTNPNIETGYCINVYVTNLNNENGIYLYHDEFGESITQTCVFTNNTIGGAVSQDNPLLATIEGSGDLADVLYGDFTASIMAIDAKAGSYTGTMQYEIKIEPISE